MGEQLLNKTEALLLIRQDLMQLLLTVKNYSQVFPLQETVSMLANEFLGHVSWGLNLHSYAETIYGPEWFSASLDEWRKRCRQSWFWKKDEFPQDWFSIPTELQDLEIWEWGDPGSTYWVGAVGPLERWWAFGNARLKSVEWQSSAKYVELSVTGSGEFSGIRDIKVKGSERKLWMLDVEPKTAKTTDVLNARLLLAQLAAYQGGGKLTVQMLRDKQVLMRLSIPRADVVPCLAEGESVLSIDTVRDVLRQILRIIVDTLTNVGDRLESALSEEVCRMEAEYEAEKANKLQKSSEQLARNLQILKDWSASF